MAKEVDTKVIQMQFDNGDFEKGVKESRKSIGELDDSIKHLSDSASGTESIDKVHKVVVDKMSIMSSVINATVSRITNNVLDSANKIIHTFDSLTIAPVSQGFSKYEEQLGSVQTIMNATGESIETVQTQLKKLMWYTDETSYSYSDMANNIGKFTSAGVELDDAVTAMMGIANWAGVSGANVQQASRAMYNLSQAMGTGSLKLQDWMSIENANMATREFKQTLIDTAKELGVLEQDTEITAENMRETLKDGWVTREVLTRTLAKYGNYTEDLYKIVGEGTEGIDGATAAMEVYSERYSDLMEQLYEANEKYGKDSEEFRAIVQKNALTMQTAMDLVDTQSKKVYNANLENIRASLIKVAETYGTSSEEFREEAEKNAFTVKDAAKMVAEGVESFKMAEVSLGEKSLRASQEAKTFKDAWDATIDGVSSSWLRFWQALFGNYEEAKELWTWLANDVFYEAFTAPIAAMADAMELAKEMGSLTELFEGFQLIWSGPADENGERHGGITAILETIKQAFMDIFGITEDDQRLSFYIYALTVRFREWAESLTLSDEKMAKLKETAKNVFTMLKAVGEIAFNLGWNITRIIRAILPSRETILKLLGDIFGEGSKVEEQVGNITDKVTFVTNVIVFAITVIKRVLVNAIKVLPQLIALTIASIVDTINNFIHSDIFKTVANIVTIVGGSLIIAVMFIVDQLSYLFSAIFNIITSIISVIEQFKNSEDKIEWLKEQFGEILKIFEPVKIIFDSVIQTFTVVSSVIGHLLNGIADFISKIDVWRAALILLVLTLVSNGVGILSFLGMVGQGVVGFVKNFITTLNPVKAIIHNFLSGISDAVDNLLNIIDVAKIEAVGHLIFTYALSVMMLAGAALMLSTIDEGKLKVALLGTAGLLAVLYAFVWGLNKLTTTKTITTVHDAVNNVTGLKEDITTIVTTFRMGLGLIGIGFAAKAMAAVVKELGIVYDAVGGNPAAFFTVIAGVAVLFLGLFAGMAFLVSTIKQSTESKTTINSDIKSLDGFVLNIDLLGGTLNKLALALVGIGIALAIMDFVDPDKLLTSAAVLGGAAIALTLLSSTISLITKKILLEKDEDALNKALGDTINSFSKVISAIAGGVFKISLALALLSLIDEDRLMSGIRGLTAITLALVSVMTIFAMLLERVNQEYIGDLKGQIGKFNNGIGASGNAGVYKTGLGGSDILMAAFAIQMLSWSLSSLALSIIPVTFVDVDKFAKAAGAIGALMTVMSTILGAFAFGLSQSDNINSVDLIKIATSIAIMSASIGLITAAILPLAAGMAVSQFVFKEEDTHPIERAGHVIAGIISAFVVYIGAIFGALGLYQKKVDLFVNDDTFLAVAKSLILMAVAVDLIAVAISGLMGMQFLTISKNEHSIRDATGAIVTVMLNITAMVTALMLSMSTIAKNGGFASADLVVKQTGRLLVLMGAAVAIVTGCIAALSLISIIPNARIKDASIAIAVVMSIMGTITDLATFLSNDAKFNSAGTLRQVGDTFLLMGTSIAIVSAGIALIAYSIGKNNTDAKAMTAAMAGLAGVIAEIGIYLFALGREAGNYTNYTSNLIKIAEATGIMALSMGVIAVAIGYVLQFGEDTYAGIGIFFTLVTIIGVYNAVMLKLMESTKGGDIMTLVAIAADFLIMAAAIALITPAIAQLAEVQKQLGDASILWSVIQGVLVPMLAMYGMVFALTKLAKGEGKDADAIDVLAISALMISLAGGMWLLAQAATVLAQIDTDKIAQVSVSIVTTMVAFTICVGILTHLSNQTGDSIPKLAISFLIFAASIWLVSEALDSMHTAMANIVDDPNVQNFGDTLASFITEHPIAAAATAVGVGIGANILLGLKDELEKQGIDILSSPFSAIAKGIEDWWKDALFGPIVRNATTNAIISGGLFTRLSDTLKQSLIKTAQDPALGGTMGPYTVAGAWKAVGWKLCLALVAGFAVGEAIKSILFAITEDESFEGPLQKFGYDIGVNIADGIRDSESVIHKAIELVTGVNIDNYGVALNNPLEDINDPDWGYIENKVSGYFNEYYSRTGKLLKKAEVRDKLAWSPTNLFGKSESWLKEWYDEGDIYERVYQQYYDTYLKAKEEYEEKQREETRKSYDIGVNALREYMMQAFQYQKEGEKHVLTYAETINGINALYGEGTISNSNATYLAYKDAYDRVLLYFNSNIKPQEEQYLADKQLRIEKQIEANHKANEEEKKHIVYKSEAEKKMVEAQEEARLKQEAARAANIVYVDEYAEKVKETGNTANAAAERFKVFQKETDEEHNENLETQDETLDSIEESTENIMTKEGARNQELANTNKLLAEQAGLTKYLNSLNEGGLAGVISQVTSSESIIGSITKWINTWKDEKISKVLQLFGGGKVNSGSLNTIFGWINQKGTSYQSLADRIKKLLGVGDDTGKTIFDMLGGGAIDLSAIKSFDINNVEASLRKIFKGDLGKTFEEIFQTSGDDFSVNAFLNNLAGDLNLEDIVKKLGEDLGDVGNYETPDFSQVTDYYNDEFAKIGYGSADSFANAYSSAMTTSGYSTIKSPLQQLGDEVVSMFGEMATHVTEIMERQAKATEQAYTTAFEAAAEVYHKEFDEDTSLLGTTKANIEAQAANIDDSVIMQSVYKRQYDYWNNRVKNLGSQILNADGTYKEGTEKRQKEYEEAVSNRDMYKSQLESERENEKTLREELKWEKQRKEYLEDPEKLAKAISDAESEKDAIYQSMVDGTFDASTDIVAELQKANDKYDKLIKLQDDIGAELVASNPDDEANAIHEGFDFNSKYSRAAWNALTRENNDITKRLKEIKNELTYLYQFKGDTETDKRIAELEQEATELRAQRTANKEFKDSMSTYEQDVMKLENLNKKIDKYETMLKEGTYLLDEPGTKGSQNIYTELQSLKKERDRLQTRINQLDSLTENGVEAGKIEEQATETDYNTFALTKNTDALNNVTNALNSFGLSEEDKNAILDSANANLNIPTGEDKMNEYLNQKGLTSYENIQKDTAAQKDKIVSDASKSMDQIKQDAEKKTADIATQAAAGIPAGATAMPVYSTSTKLAGPMSKEELLSETTSETTVSDIVIISNDVAAIRIASENILSTLVSWRGEIGQHNAYMAQSMANIQNRGVPIANRMSFMNEMTDAVDMALGSKVTRRARGN